MARPYADEEEEKPLDPAVEKVRRRLVRFVAINLGILLAALMAVGVALVYKGRSAPAAGPRETVEAALLIPADARIISQSLSGERLSLELELSGGKREIRIFDTATGRLVGRLAVVAQ